MSTTDGNGIVFLEETDNISPFHTLINGMQQGTSDAFTGVKEDLNNAIGDLENALDFLPFRTAAGTVTIVGTGATTGTASVTFPEGRFTQTPLVVIGGANTAGGAVLLAQATTVSTSGATFRLVAASGGGFSATYTIPWFAIQMTSSSAAG